MTLGNGRKLAIVLGTLVVALIVAALVTSRRESQDQFHTVGDAAAAIRRDLPKGTTRKNVQAWLDARHIDRTSNAAASEEIGLLHNVRKNAVSRTDLRIVFTFDKTDQLATFLVEELSAARHGEEDQESIRD
jgi:hypothetical protein